MVNSPLITSYLLEGVALGGGGTLDSHDYIQIPCPSNSPSKHSKPKVASKFRQISVRLDRIWSPFVKQWGIFPKKTLEVGRWQMIGSFLGLNDLLNHPKPFWAKWSDQNHPKPELVLHGIFRFFFFWGGGEGGGDDLQHHFLNGDLGVTLWFASTVWVPYRVYVRDYPTHWIGYIGLFRVV